MLHFQRKEEEERGRHGKEEEMGIEKDSTKMCKRVLATSGCSVHDRLILFFEKGQVLDTPTPALACRTTRRNGSCG